MLTQVFGQSILNDGACCVSATRLDAVTRLLSYRPTTCVPKLNQCKDGMQAFGRSQPEPRYSSSEVVVMATPVTTSKTQSPELVGTLKAFLRTTRPHQWVKNLLCFVPVVFTGNLTDMHMVMGSAMAVVAFCFASAAVYTFNDLKDRKQDQLHPVKKNRPIASGKLPVRFAVAAMVVLMLAAMGIAAYCNYAFLAVMSFYLAQNVAYTCGLKRIVILDVMLVANGFLLRAAGGAFAIDVTASPWLVLCTLTLALLVAFGKRRHEITLLGDAEAHRHTLGEYSEAFLDQSMSMAAASAWSCIRCSQFRLTLSEHTDRKHWFCQCQCCCTQCSDSYSLFVSKTWGANRQRSS